MKTILMCEPIYYGVEYIINPWMDGNIDRVNVPLARIQWSELYSIVKTVAKVELIDGYPHLPDMVFTANAGLVVNKSIILSQFKNVERKDERFRFEKWFEEHDYDIAAASPGVIFEGAGDCLVGSDVYWCGYGFRTSRSGAKHISDILQLWYGKKATPIKLIDERFYHFDTCFCPLNDGSVMLYRPAIDPLDFEKIQNVFGEHIIEVSEEDAVNFSCNAVNINDVIVLNKVSSTLKYQLRERGFEVIETPTSEFIKSGGSCKCLTLEI